MELFMTPNRAKLEVGVGQSRKSLCKVGDWW